MSYERINFQNGITDIDQVNMNQMDKGIYQNSLVNNLQSIEITKLWLENNLMKLSGVGFYDIFDTIDDVNSVETTATVNTTNQDVTYNANGEILVMNSQTFGIQAEQVSTVVYSKSFETAEVVGNFTNVDTIIAAFAEAPIIGQVIQVGDKFLTVQSVTLQ